MMSVFNLLVGTKNHCICLPQLFIRNIHKIYEWVEYNTYNTFKIVGCFS